MEKGTAGEETDNGRFSVGLAKLKFGNARKQKLSMTTRRHLLLLALGFKINEMSLEGSKDAAPAALNLRVTTGPPGGPDGLRAVPQTESALASRLGRERCYFSAVTCVLKLPFPELRLLSFVS